MTASVTPLERGEILRQGKFSEFGEQLLSELRNYNFDFGAIPSYHPSVIDQIRHAVQDLRQVASRSPSRGLIRSFSSTSDKALNSDDPIERDQAVWSLIAHGHDAVRPLIRAIETAPSTEAQISSLLALRKVFQYSPEKVLGFLAEISSDSEGNVDLREWAQLSMREFARFMPDGSERLAEPVCERRHVHYDNKAFDVTMPLKFECNACTRFAGRIVKTRISPAWFSQIFGNAMALVKAETFHNRLILEKAVTGLHSDNSIHYEHFPFSGQTAVVGPRCYRHNYWAQVFRPFYASGRVERVDSRNPVVIRVPMTFFRLACTLAPAKYELQGRPLPESVRGVFFGYGHISPRTLLTRGKYLRPGDFQISSRINPVSGKPANTYYYGTFYGKLGDTDSRGQLELNGRPVHCSVEGQLDYRGDGCFSKDPVRPDDW